MLNKKKQNNKPYMYYQASQSSRNNRRGNNLDSSIIFLILAIIAIVALVGVVVYKIYKARLEESFSQYADDASLVHYDTYIDLSSLGTMVPINVVGMNQDQIYEAVSGCYEWNVKIKNGNPNLANFELPVINQSYEESVENDGTEGTPQSEEVESKYSKITITLTKSDFDLPDVLDSQIKKFVETSYQDILRKQENPNYRGRSSKNKIVVDYTFKPELNSDELTNYISQLKTMWDTQPENGALHSYDKKARTFVFSKDLIPGYSIKADILYAEISSLITNRKFTTTLVTSGDVITEGAIYLKDKYREMASFQTKTTNNKVRNENVRLAAEAVNGTILKPGEEFSFNKVVGERTEEKGYGAATAYVGGEVVQELGGGVCQVSSTLYNAIFQAGLATTYRRSHTYIPTYVTPGLDATVSWLGVDFRFVNSSDYPIGIICYYKNNIVKVSIIGIPILEEGITINLESVKLSDSEIPPTSVVAEGEKSKGTQGSEWQVYKVTKKNGKEIDRVHDHYTEYKGHTPILPIKDLIKMASKGQTLNGEEIDLEKYQDLMTTAPVETTEVAETTKQENNKESAPESKEPEPVLSVEPTVLVEPQAP